MNGIKIQHSTMFFMINPEATNTMTFNPPYHNLGIQNGKNHASPIMYTSKPSTARRLLFDNPHGGGKEVPLDVSNISTNKVNLYTEQNPKNPLKASIDFRKEILLRFKQLNRVQCDKWNFDFRREQPLPGPYQWQRCVKRKFGVNLHINNSNTFDNIISNTVTSSPRKTFRRNVSPLHIAESTDRFNSLLRLNLNSINNDTQILSSKPATPLNIQNGDSRILSALQSRAELSDDLLMVDRKNLDPKPDNLLEHLEGMPCFNLKCEKCDDINADKTNLTTTYQSKITDFFPIKKSSMFRPHTLENAKLMSFHNLCQPQTSFINSKQTLENFMECSGKATLENKLNSLMMDCTVPPPT